MIGEAWSISLVEGRIQNISDRPVEFQGLISYIKDENDNVIWEEADERFIKGGRIEPLESLSFAYNPISATEARTVELLVKDAEVLSR